MATSLTHRLAIRINGGQPLGGDLTIEQELIDVSVAGASEPDPRWTFTDSCGHFHAWSANEDNQLPTLRAETITEPCGCDDEDEVLVRTVFFCLVCGEPVEPGFRPDRGAENRQIPGRRSATITARGTGERPTLGEEVSVVIEDEGVTLFGLATTQACSGGPEGWEATLAARSIEPRLT